MISYDLKISDLDYINKMAKYYTYVMCRDGFYTEYEEMLGELNLLAVQILRTFDPKKASFKTYFTQVSKNYIIKKKDDMVKKRKNIFP